MNIVQLSITLHCFIWSPHLPNFTTKVACICIPKNHVNCMDFLHLMSKSCGFGMTGPLDESISCFLIRMDPRVLVPWSSEDYTPCQQRATRPHLKRTVCPHFQRTACPYLQRATRPRHQRTACPHLQRATRPRHQRNIHPHLLRATRPHHQRTAC